MPVLVLNAGSSSLKWELFATPELASLKSGAVGRIGEPGSPVPDHAAALRTVFAELGDVRPDAVGHRVVHGGEFFTGPVRVDADVTARIASLVPLAPLHNPPALAGIAAAGELLPGVPQAAVFDTAFHQTLEPAAYRYALPEWCYTEHRVRRYGMHGTSHQFVSRAAAEFLNSNPADLNLVSLHLGNGASVAAVAGGRCVDTSMGLTPLEGLVMGTRSGDLDPAVVPYLCRQTGMPVAAVERLLNRDSGLKGLCGANDMREVTAAAAGGDGHAELALTMFCRRAATYVGAYAVVLGRLDAVVFTAGIGENSPVVRARICDRLGLLGVAVDREANEARSSEPRRISPPDAAVSVLVVPTDEEREIARQTLDAVGGEST